MEIPDPNHPRNQLSKKNLEKIDTLGLKVVRKGKAGGGGGRKAGFVGTPGYFTGRYGVQKDAVQKARLQKLAQDSRNRKIAYLNAPGGTLAGWKAASKLKMAKGPSRNQKAAMLMGRINNAVRIGLITEADKNSLQDRAEKNGLTISEQFYQDIAPKRGLYQRDAATGRFLKSADGTRKVNTMLIGSALPLRAGAYDIQRMTGKTHTKKIARYLAFLGPQSIIEFVNFDKTFYPLGPKTKTITQNEVADFVDYTIFPWEDTKAGASALARRGDRQVAGNRDVEALRLALIKGKVV